MSTVKREAENVIERWMLATMADGGVDRFDDLHIDRIDPKWREQNAYIESGVEAFRIAIGVRNRKAVPFSVVLAFSLNSDGNVNGMDFRTKEELRAQLGSSPPSLYLFRRGEEPRTQNESAHVESLDLAIVGAKDGVHCYYIEFKQQGTDEYSRSVFVEG
jgi:hypothetical protein